MKTFAYILAPFVGWCVSGGLKFLVNSIKAKKLALDQIGTYGGIPSTHTTIVSSVMFLIGFREGFDSPAFGATLALAVIVIMDATGLRRYVGKHAAAINALSAEKPDHKTLRERLGHKRLEIFAGLCVGALCGFGLHYLAMQNLL